jgi:hypothetical protein
MLDHTSSEQQRAAEELLKRRSIRKSLTEWARHKVFEPAKHHLLIINEIESFLADDDEVLLLFAPPGLAKITYVRSCCPRGISPRIRHTAFSLRLTRWSLPNAGADEFATT